MQEMYLLGLIFILNLSYQIQGVHYFMEMVEVELLDPVWFDSETSSFEIDFINDTFTGLDVNLTIIKDIPEDTYGIFNIYYKSMDEYSVSSGLNLFLPVCDWLTEQVMVGSFFTALGLTKENCPPKAGIYGTSGLWYPSRDRMPSMMPAVDSKVTFGLAIGEKDILKAFIYVEVTDSST